MKCVGRFEWLPGFVVTGLTVFLALGLSGCGGSSSQPVGVSLTSSVAGSAIDQAQTVLITASVTNDSKTAGVTWSVSGTSGSPRRRTTLGAACCVCARMRGKPKSLVKSDMNVRGRNRRFRCPWRRYGPRMTSGPCHARRPAERNPASRAVHIDRKAH